MKNYIIVAVIIILIIVGVVWYKSKSPAMPVGDEVDITTEPVAPIDDTSMMPVDDSSVDSTTMITTSTTTTTAPAE